MPILTRNMTKNDLHEVIQIHLKAFQGFFLTLLGDKFLFDLYKSFILDDFSICIIAEKNRQVKGFIIGNLKPDSLFRKMIIHKGFRLLLHSVKALRKNPILVLQKLLYAIHYRGERPDAYSNAALISSVGVDPNETTKGIGSQLVNEFCDEAFSKGSDVVYLTTDKIGNDHVNSFYLKNGFQIESVIEKTKGRKMNRYIKLPNEKVI